MDSVLQQNPLNGLLISGDSGALIGWPGDSECMSLGFSLFALYIFHRVSVLDDFGIFMGGLDGSIPLASRNKVV